MWTGTLDSDSSLGVRAGSATFAYVSLIWIVNVPLQV